MNIALQLLNRTPIVLLLCLAGCGQDQSVHTRNASRGALAFRPETFREDINSLIAQREYAAATEYLDSANAAQQAQFDKNGYLAVGEDAIVLPGIAPSIYYDRKRDWFMPGTSDAIEDIAWQEAATTFAEEYNRARMSDAASNQDITSPAASELNK
jgi:hypothetical protein